MINFLSVSSEETKMWKALDKERCISRDDFKTAQRVAREAGRQLTEVLLETESTHRDTILKVLGEILNFPHIKLVNTVISPAVLNLLPKEIAEQHSIVIFKKIKNIIHVATTAPQNTETIEFIKKQTGFEPKVFITTAKDIAYAIRKYQGEISEEFSQIIQNSMQEALAQNDTAEKMAHFLPIIKMVNTIIERAILNKASDIHIEPSSKKITIRFRIDGLLQKIVELPPEILPSLVARIRLMANLKIDEHRRPQDGRFKYFIGDKEVAIRVSAIPTLYGIKIVLRILDAPEKQFTLRHLGFNAHDLKTIKQQILKPQGLILVTGPTGSGKTTTLYTFLKILHKEVVNICTIEDPIEYGIDGINQTQVNPDGGITFAAGLRSLLRQDPNVIMVGEIRDGETAEIAMHAAMTGHLVLSTLHTNSSYLAPQRLVEMGVPPYLVASVVNVIFGQRLVRKICDHCRTQAYFTSKVFDRYRTQFECEKLFAKYKSLGVPLPVDDFSQLKISYGKGCKKCNNMGYSGRLGIYEILDMDDSLHKLILDSASADAIAAAAGKRGVLTMQEDGLLKVFLGLTTFEEILRVTRD